VKLKRIRILKKGKPVNGPIVYWMSRDQRFYDNWALVYARELSIQKNTPLYVVFCLVPEFLNSTMRQYGFMIEGLKEVERTLKKFYIPFFLLIGEPVKQIPEFIKNHKISVLVTDFDPLKIKKKWKKSIIKDINIDFFEVDAHNIIPCWQASDKQEYGAYTIRPKLKKLLDYYLEDYPVNISAYKHKNIEPLLKNNISWDSVLKNLKIDKNVIEVKWIRSGYKNAMKNLNIFLKNKIFKYDIHRNDPNKDSQSNLSPYLHFGQLSALRIVLEIAKLNIKEDLKEPFLEELIIRRELSDNYCFYNYYYDSFDGFPDWAKDTLNAHRNDKRDHIYNLDKLEKAETHDELWNASQLEMLKTGKMHGYMRMYWAKKILEWAKHPEEALEYAIYLNDKYELDGRDPNGYAGIAWSIGGLHDRPWRERNIFGKIRYMSYEGCKRKFDIRAYIDKIGNM
jgi:deoxyribodipyrimidine photo-lyase